MLRVRHRSITVLLAAAGLASAASTGRAATISVTSANVNSPGDTAQICAVLSGGNTQIAGTQNDLVWDGNCATLPDPPPCNEVPGHPKHLSKTLSRVDSFTFRGIMLSFGDTDPMPDGPMYCCQFQVEADPGSCCTVRVTNSAGSDPGGNPVSVMSGSPGQLCTRSDQSGRGGGGFNSPSMNQPLSASNAPADGGGAAAPPQAAPPAAGRAGGVPPSQVLQGGGTAPNAPLSGVGAAPGAVSETPEAGAPAGAGAPAVAPPTLPRPALAPPTAAAPLPTRPAVAVPTQPAMVAQTPAHRDTPTRPLFSGTHVPTRPAVGNAKQAAPAVAEKGGGWFGCQIAAGSSAAPLLGLGGIALAGALLLRRRAARRR